jgi:hypothetical protein
MAQPRWLRRSQQAQQADPFDPVAEGARVGLDRDTALAIWHGVRAGGANGALAQRRFRELAAELAPAPDQ